MSLGVQSWEEMTCAVCAWTILADSVMSPVYTLHLVLCALMMCYLQVRHQLGECREVIHSAGGGPYSGVAVSSDGLLAVADCGNTCIRLLRNINQSWEIEKSIGEGVLGGSLRGMTIDLNGNVWVADMVNYKVRKFSQDGELRQTIDRAGGIGFNHPTGVSVSPEGQVYICDKGNHRVTVHDANGTFKFAFGSRGINSGFFDGPRDVTFAPDGLVYVTDEGNNRVCVWSKEGRVKRHFGVFARPSYIAATGDNHLVISSEASHTVRVYPLGGGSYHEFGWHGSDRGRFNRPCGICVDDSGAVYVADSGNNRVQVF